MVSLALLGWLLYHAYWPAAHGLDIGGAPLGRDFMNVWLAPYLASHGQQKTLLDLQPYSVAAAARFGEHVPNYCWSYPPITLLLYYGFSLPSYFWGLALWTGLGLLAMLVTFRAYCPSRGWAEALLLLSPACIINLISGQNGFWTAALLVGGLLGMRKRPALAGVAFGLLTFKPQLGIVLPFALLAMRAWRTILFAVLTFALLLLASVMAFGIEIWKDYFSQTVGSEMAYLYHFQGMYAAMMLSPFAGLRRLGLSYSDASALQVVASIIVVTLAFRRLCKVSNDRNRAFIVVSAATLVSPYLFNYDLVALSIPLTCALYREQGARSWFVPVYLVAWLAPLLGMFVALSGLPLLQALFPLAFAGVFISTISSVQPKQDFENPKKTGGHVELA